MEVGLAGLLVIVLTAVVKLLEQRARNPLRAEIERLADEVDRLTIENRQLRTRLLTHESPPTDTNR